MPFLLDSNILIDHLDENAEAVALLQRLAHQDLMVMSTISYMEIFQGIVVDQHPARAQEKFDALVAAMEMLPVTQAIAHRCALVRVELTRRGKRVRQRALDLLIAATAIEHNLTLVTRNQVDYSDIPGIVLFEDF